MIRAQRSPSADEAFDVRVQYFIGFNQFRVIVILRKSSGSQKTGMKFETIFSGLHDAEYDIPLATWPGAAGRNHFSD